MAPGIGTGGTGSKGRGEPEPHGVSGLPQIHISIRRGLSALRTTERRQADFRSLISRLTRWDMVSRMKGLLGRVFESTAAIGIYGVVAIFGLGLIAPAIHHYGETLPNPRFHFSPAVAALWISAGATAILYSAYRIAVHLKRIWKRRASPE